MINASFRWLLRRYARPHAGMIALMLVLTFVGNVLTVVQPAILAALLTNISGRAAAPASGSWFNLNQLGPRVTGWLTGTTGLDVLLLFALLFVGVSIGAAIISYLSESSAAWISKQVGCAIQVELAERLLAQDMAFFAEHKSGELTSRVTFDAVQAAYGVGPIIRRFVHYLVQAVVYAAYLFGTSRSMTFGAIGLVGLQFGISRMLKAPTHRFVRAEADVSAAFTASLSEAFTNIRVAKSFGAERFELAKLRAAAQARFETVWRKDRVSRLEEPARTTLDSLAVLGVFLIAIAQVRAGALTFEGLILFTYVARSLITPINQLATTALVAESVGASAGHVRELMSSTPAVTDGTVVPGPFAARVRFEDVSFAYHADHPALDGVTLEIGRGEFVALVGPSGAGKSTLADLLLRLRDPLRGTITLDGIDLRTLRLRDYRRLFGVVSQESLLFHDTVRNNIRYGRDEITDAMIEAAARVANAHEFITRLPEGYDTVVGDRGLRLSGGERQRIAIARAVVHQPQILILDEATSALDSESERQVQQAIDKVVAGATALVIAHRLSTVTHADRIVVLNSGRIEAVGRHDELLRTSRTYRRFCELQFDTPGDRVAT